jgi:lipopolysaccharide export system protein LptA
MDFLVRNGKTLGQAVTQGPSQITILPVEGTGGKDAATTVASAGKFEASFDIHNRLERVMGTPDAKVVSSALGQPAKTSTSDRLEVAFHPTGGISALLQDGHFHYSEPNQSAGERAAWADHARYTPADQVLVLAGSPRIVEGGLTTTADSLRLDRGSGDAVASGNVKSTYSELKPQPGGALLATADPIHVTARAMTAQRSTGLARYVDARLWQDANVVEAPVLDFHRDPRTLEARGDASHRVTTVFVQKETSGKLTPVNVTAAKLTYTDAQRQARFEGGVVVRGSDATVTAVLVDVFLHARGQSSSAAGSAGAPSQIDRIVATGEVILQQPSRRATGQKLVFSAAEGKFVLTGGPPSIFDAERGKITGDSLTFYNRDDRVLVESSSSSPTITQTRVAK